MARQRKVDMDMYKLYVQDGSFLQALMDTMKKMTGSKIFRITKP
jgi:hypothetical protein